MIASPVPVATNVVPWAGLHTPSNSTPLLSVVATLGLPGDRGISAGPPAYDPENGYVYVPGFVSDHVAVVNGTSLVATVPVAGNATVATYDPSNRYVYISASNASTLTVLDDASVVGTVAVPKCTSLPGWDQPAVDLANGFVYVPSSCSNSVVVVDGTSVVGTVTVAGGNGSNVGRAASYDPADGDVYVGDHTGNLSVINGTTVLATLDLNGWIDAGTYDAGNGLLYVTDSTSGTEFMVSGTTVVANLTFGGAGYAGGIASSASYDSANGLIYVPYQGFRTGHGSVAVLNGTTEVTDLNVGPEIAEAASYGSFGNGTGFIYETTGESLNGGLGVGTVDAIGGTSVAGNVSFPSEPNGAVYDPENGYVYLPTYTPNSPTSGAATNDTLVVVACALCVGVTVAESGAPAGSTWSVTASNVTTEFAETLRGAAPSSLTLHLTGGLYGLSVTVPAGTEFSVASHNATYNASTGTLTVAPGSPPPPPPPINVVTFNAKGLPAGAPWSVALGGRSEVVAGTSASFEEPNGVYPLLVEGPSGYRASDPTGNLTVSGNATVPITFSRGTTFSVAFREAGLKPKQSTPWCVTLQDLQRCTTGSKVAYANLAPADYDYRVLAVPGWSVSAKEAGMSLPLSGSLQVTSANAGVALRYEPVRYALAFTGSGLSSGSWSIRVDCTTAAGCVGGFQAETLRAHAGHPIVFELGNGTYAFTIGTERNYSSSASPPSPVVVDGASPATIAVTFVPTG